MALVRFSNESADDENLALDSAAINKLGSIEIEVTRVRNLGASNDTTHQLSVNGVGPVHEKSKKVGGHCVSYVSRVFLSPFT